MKKSIANGNSEYIHKLKEELKSIPEPNEGRVEEIKEQIKKGALITKEAILTSAQRIAAILLGKNN